jgi:hypothetical protein
MQEPFSLPLPPLGFLPSLYLPLPLVAVPGSQTGMVGFPPLGFPSSLGKSLVFLNIQPRRGNRTSQLPEAKLEMRWQVLWLSLEVRRCYSAI